MEHLEPSGSSPIGHLGDARRAAALHLLQNDGLGRLRSRRAARRATEIRSPVEKWKTIREPFTAKSAPRAFNKKKNSFVQAYGSSQLDAALLLMPAVGFLPGSDPRVKATVEAIERELMPTAWCCATTLRKWTTACRPAKASSSPAASGWSAASRPSGAFATPSALFTRLLNLRNDLGLLSEEYDVHERKRFVGNFPRPSRTSRWSTPHSIWKRLRAHRNSEQTAAKPKPTR
jgi:hypothetical protein